MNDFLDMANLELNIEIHNLNFEPIENNVLYNIRNLIARCFENSEFGRVMEVNENNFGNVFIHPETDEYYTPENSLLQTYRFPNPINRIHGNISLLLLQELPLFVSQVREIYNVICDIRLHIYSNI